jgi:hypothetical protein
LFCFSVNLARLSLRGHHHDRSQPRREGDELHKSAKIRAIDGRERQIPACPAPRISVQFL